MEDSDLQQIIDSDDVDQLIGYIEYNQLYHQPNQTNQLVAILGMAIQQKKNNISDYLVSIGIDPVEAVRTRYSTWRLRTLDDFDESVPIETQLRTILSEIPDEFRMYPQAFTPEQRMDVMNFVHFTVLEHDFGIQVNRTTGRYELV